MAVSIEPGRRKFHGREAEEVFSGHNGTASHRDVADPGKVVLAVGSLLAALKRREVVPLIVQVVDPGELLKRSAFQVR